MFMLNFEFMFEIMESLLSKIHSQTLSSESDLFTLFEISASNNNLTQWHQCYFLIQKQNMPPLNREHKFVFGEKFEKIYRIKTFELHPTHVLEIWQLFLANFDTKNRCTMRLFFLFISHIRIVDNRKDSSIQRFLVLIDSTVERLENETSPLKCKCECLFQIYYSLASIVVNFIHYQQTSPIELKSDAFNLYDLTTIFPKTTVKYWRKCYDNFDNLSDDRDEKIYLIRLLLLNYRLIKQRDNNVDHHELFNKLLNQVLISKTLLVGDVFNFLLSELNSNQDLVSILEFLFDTFINNNDDDGDESNETIKAIFHHQQHWESKCFQNVLITLFLKKIHYLIPQIFNDDSLMTQQPHWLKYGCDIPDSTIDKHMKMIQSLQTFSDQIIQTDRSLLDDEMLMENNRYVVDKCTQNHVRKLFEIFLQCVPLEYIAPFNQIRLILISWAIQLEFIKNDAANQFSPIFVPLNLRLWCSVRKIWFFDFISPSKYIYTLLANVCDYFINECPTLFDRLIATMFRMNDKERLLQSLEHLINLLKCHDNVNEKGIGYVFMLETILLRNFRQFKRRMEKSNHHLESEFQCQLFANHKQLIRLMYKMVNEFFQQQKLSNKHKDFVFVIEASTELFEEKLIDRGDASSLINCKGKWRKLFHKFLSLFDDENLSITNHGNDNECLIHFIRFIAHNRQKLAHLLPDDLLMNRWNEIVVGVKLTATIDSTGFCHQINSKSDWKKIFQSEENFHNFKTVSDEMFQFKDMAKRFDECDKCIDTIDPLLGPILESIIDVNEMENSLRQCLDHLHVHCLDLAQAKFYVHILAKMATETTMNSKEKTQVLNNHFSEIIETMMMISFLSNNKFTDNNNCSHAMYQIKVKILQFCHDSLDRFIQFDLITNEHLFLIYNLCFEVNIFAYGGRIGLYCELFARIQEIIHLTISRRPYLAIASMCTGRNVIRANLASLIQMTNEQTLGNATDTEKMQLEQCSNSLQQSIAHLSQYDQFHPYAQHLIADYLELSLNNPTTTTVTTMIKQNLQQSMYHLIDSLMKKQTNGNVVKNLYSRLNQKSRQLFRKLLEYHDHYYRFKGYV